MAEWSDREISELRAGYSTGRTNAEIAADLGRTVNAVRNKAHDLQLNPKDDTAQPSGSPEPSEETAVPPEERQPGNIKQFPTGDTPPPAEPTEAALTPPHEAAESAYIFDPKKFDYACPHGICPFCGQGNIALDYEDCDTQAERDHAAMLRCHCTDAVIAAAKEKRIEKAQERIQRLFGSGARELGFRPIQGDSIFILMNLIVEQIANYEIQSATIQISSKTKAKIATTSKGIIKVERTETSKYQLEE